MDCAQINESKWTLSITEPFSPFYLEEMKNYWSPSVSRAVSQVRFKFYFVYLRVCFVYISEF